MLVPEKVYGGIIMFCTNCGRQCSDDRKFCASCGSPLHSEINEVRNDQSAGVTNYTANKVNYTEKSKEENVIPYKGFFSLPRVMGLIGALFLAISCVMPIFTFSDGSTFNFINTNVTKAALLLPILILLNTIFDKSLVTISLSGVHFRFMRFKLCILWGLAGIVMLFGVVMIHDVASYEIPFCVGIVGCAISIIAPFFVNENDGSGIKPVKKYDFIWIGLAVVIVFVLLFRLYSVGFNGYNAHVGSAAGTDTYSDSNGNVNNTDTPEVQTQTNPVENKELSYTEKMKKVIKESGGNKYRVYDINNDGNDDIIIFYKGSATDGWNDYKAYVYEGNEFKLAGSFEGVAGDDARIYKSKYIGFYVYEEDLSGDTFKYVYSKYEYTNGRVEPNVNDFVEETVYGDYIVDGKYVGYNFFIQNVNIINGNYLQFSDINDYSSVENAHFKN